MTKHFLVFATVALFVLLANASVFRTVVEFDEEHDVSNQMDPQQDKCHKEFMKQRQLGACQKWIRGRAQKGRIGYAADDFELTLDVDLENDENPMPPPRKTLTRCCYELQQVDKMCVCPTLKEAAQQVSSEGMHGPQQVKDMFRTAKNLPIICQTPEVSSCKFKATPY